MMKAVAVFLFFLLFAIAPAHANVLDDVMKAGKIRCAYVVYPPYFEKDPVTGKMSGIYYDLMNEIGKLSDITITWTEEVGYEQVFSGLDSGRYDAVCNGLWQSAERAKHGLFTTPVYFDSVFAWGRKDDTRFDKSLDGIDNENIKIATVDSAMEDIIAKSSFPKAHRVSLPALSAYKMNLVNVMEGKADVTFAEPTVVHEFLKSHTNTLKALNGGKPVRVFGGGIVMKRGETDLKEFLDAAIRELNYSGFTDRLLKQYEPYPGAFRRAAEPYQ